MIQQIKNIVKNRRKYQASCAHKILTFVPACFWKQNKEILKMRAMYSEGEDRYLKDLDCVNIVKLIRELKALTRVILSQQQRQLLAFERESVLPSNKVLETQEHEFIQKSAIWILLILKETGVQHNFR